jgi:hypothetical protein
MYLKKKILGFLLSLPLTTFAAIEDNSFLLEEAFNQEWGVYQFIQKYQTSERAKGYEYTSDGEIPITDKTHQFSYSFSYARPESPGHGAVSDMTLNYRIQPYNKDGILLADRFGLIVPTGNVEKGTGSGVYGFEFMQAATIAISEQFTTHFNFGFDVLPNAKTANIDKRRTLTGFTGGSSVVYLMNDNFNVLLEGLLQSGQSTLPDGTITAQTTFTINPGLRWAMDFDWKEAQVVQGISFPTELLNRPQEHGVLFYLSIEPKFY